MTVLPAKQFRPLIVVPAALAEHSRYEIIGLIGKGGMGDVYKALHRKMERTVALKVINHGLVRKPEAVNRFHREVKTAAQLSHSNIVTAYDADQAGEFHFMVMEHVDGVNLAQTVKEHGALPVAEACDFVRQAAIGLQHAHELGMVHRDIKPHNLMVSADGTIKILDFGLASLAPEVLADGDAVEARGELTSAGSIMGTPDFISPEQAKDAREADIRSDIYSLGATLYFLLSGRPPFPEGSVVQKLKNHAEFEPEPLDALRKDVPADLLAVVSRMMAKSSQDRFQTPAEVAEALGAFLKNTASHELHQPEKKVKPIRSKKRILSLTAIAALFLGIIASIIFYIQTDYGVVRVEVTDPTLEVIIDGQTIKMSDGKNTTEIRTGDKKLIIRQPGSDFQFETESFQIRRGEKITFKVDMFPGEIIVTKNDKSFAKASVLVGKWLAEGPGNLKFRLTFNPDGTFAMDPFESADLIEFSATGTYAADFSVSPAHLDLYATIENAQSLEIFSKNDTPPQDEDDATAAVGRGHDEFGDTDLAAPAHASAESRTRTEKHKFELIIEVVDANTIRMSDLEANTRPKTFGDRTMVLSRQGVSKPADGLEISPELRAEKGFPTSGPFLAKLQKELYANISRSAGIPNDQWEKFASTDNASTDAIKGTPLTWVLLMQRPGGDENAAIRMLTDKPAPMRDIYSAMSPSQPNGYVSLIQPQYITRTKLGFNRESSEFKGTVWFEVPKLYKGKFEFTMFYHVGRIIITEFALPEADIRLVRENGLWEKRTTSNQSAAHKAASVNNLRQIAKAFMMFEEEHGYLPSVTTKLPGTKHPVSWRVAILNYLDEGLYDEYKLDEPWYSDHNKKLLEKLPSFYRHPSQAKDDTNTGYMTLVGETTATGNGETPTTDSDAARTILVTEATTNIPWTKPEDHLVDDKSFLPGRRPDRNGWNVVFVDGSSHFISADTSPDVLKALVTRDSLDQIENKNGVWKKVGETGNDKGDKTLPNEDAAGQSARSSIEEQQHMRDQDVINFLYEVNPEFQRSVADSFIAQGDYEGAKRVLSSIQPADPRATAALKIAMIQQQKGEIEKAADSTIEAIGFTPSLLSDKQLPMIKKAGRVHQLVEVLTEERLSKLGYNNRINAIVKALLNDEATRADGFKLLARLSVARSSEYWQLLRDLPQNVLNAAPDPAHFMRMTLIPTDFAAEGSGWERFGISLYFSGAGNNNYNVWGPLQGLPPITQGNPSKNAALNAVAQEVEHRLTQHPEWKAGVAVLGYLQAELGNEQQAVALFEKALAEKDSPMPPNSAWAFALVLEGKGKALDQIAMRLYERKIAGPNDNGRPWRFWPSKDLADLYAKYGRRKEARDLLFLMAEPETEVICTPGYKNNDANSCVKCHKTDRSFANFTAFSSKLSDIGYPVDAYLQLARIDVSYHNLASSDAKWANQNAHKYIDTKYSTVSAIRSSTSPYPQAKNKAVKGITPQAVLSALESGVFIDRDMKQPVVAASAAQIDLMLGVRGKNGKPTLFSPVIELLENASKTKGDKAAVANVNIDQLLAEAFDKNPDNVEAGIAATVFAFLRNDFESAEKRLQKLVELVDGKESQENDLSLWLVAREALKHQSTKAVGEKLADRALTAAGKQSDPLWKEAIQQQWQAITGEQQQE